MVLAYFVHSQFPVAVLKFSAPPGIAVYDHNFWKIRFFIVDPSAVLCWLLSQANPKLDAPGPVLSPKIRDARC